MRAVVDVEKRLSKFTKLGTMRPPAWWDILFSNGHAGPSSSLTESSKGSRAKFSDAYVRDRHSYTTLTAGLILVAFFVIFICSFDTSWDFAEEQRELYRHPHRSLAFTGGASQAVVRGSGTRIEWDVAGKRKVSALHGMGVTFRAGSRAMNELVIAHLSEQTSPEELRMFLRTLHRSGATARADVVLIFPWSLPDSMSSVIDEEERSFQRLILERQATAPPHSRRIVKSTPNSKEGEQVDAKTHEIGSFLQQAPPEIRPFPPSNLTISPFNARAFWKSREERKGRAENITMLVNRTGGGDELVSIDWADWGSIIGFEVQDLDQGDILDGFIENPPVQLRRWTCYQMVLGMTKTRYRVVLLAEVRGTVILRDILAAARKKAFDSSINLYSEDLTWNDVHKARKRLTGPTVKAPQDPKVPENISDAARMHGRELAESEAERNLAVRQEQAGDSRPIGSRNLEMHFIEEVYGRDVWKKMDREDKEKSALGTAFIIGSVKPIRTLCNAILTEIAALALKRKSREAFHDRALLNYLVHKSTVLSRRVMGKLHMVGNAESSVHSLPGSRQPSVFFRADGHGFAALLGLMDDSLPSSKVISITEAIQDEICSQGDSWAYPDCSS